MSDNKNTEYANQLRIVATEMRKQAAEMEQLKLQKCAQVLVAARGLVQLNQMLHEVTR